MLSERDLRARLETEVERFPDAATDLLSEPVEATMRPDPITISSDATLRDALEILADERIGAAHRGRRGDGSSESNLRTCSATCGNERRHRLRPRRDVTSAARRPDGARLRRRESPPVGDDAVPGGDASAASLTRQWLASPCRVDCHLPRYANDAPLRRRIVDDVNFASFSSAQIQELLLVGVAHVVGVSACRKPDEITRRNLVALVADVDEATPAEHEQPFLFCCVGMLRERLPLRRDPDE
jgi:CBS domain-containing protein